MMNLLRSARVRADGYDAATGTVILFAAAAKMSRVDPRRFTGVGVAVRTRGGSVILDPLTVGSAGSAVVAGWTNGRVNEHSAPPTTSTCGRRGISQTSHVRSVV